MTWPDTSTLPAPAAITIYVLAFLVSLALLAWGADLFVDEAAIVARKGGISPVLVGLLTAGAEWEELFVVVAAISQGSPDLAIGNIIGSSISNILSAFSIGLLFKRGELEFDGSAKFYALLLFSITALIAPLEQLQSLCGMRRPIGMVLLSFFAVYLASIGLAIRQGRLAQFEDSSSESDSESTSQDESFAAETAAVSQARVQSAPVSAENQPLLRATPGPDVTHGPRPLSYHLLWLLIGLLAVLLSAPILAGSSLGLAKRMNISETLFGVVFLSFATTVPEKAIAILSGYKGQGGMLASSTVGSNIFLLTLCLGVLWTSTGRSRQDKGVDIVEMAVLIASTGALTLSMWLGERARLMGVFMLGGYVAFLILEFTVVHKHT